MEENMICVSDYIRDFLIKKNISTVFTISGGFSMTLQNSLCGSPAIKNYFQHHEAACGYAAVGYAKTVALPPVVLTTAGCGATNAISPCLVAYQDSNPIMFISGQVKSEDTIRKLRKTGPQLRHYSMADCDIISMVDGITKYSHEITSPDEVPAVFNAAYAAMVGGRPGPVWISVPLDIQGMMMPKNELDGCGFIYMMGMETGTRTGMLPQPKLERTECKNHDILKTSLNDAFENIEAMITVAQRPLILAGGGIKSAKCEMQFRHFIERFNIPFVHSIHATSILPTNHQLSQGGVGIIANRCGNFTIQNCDLLLCLGCRMSQAIIGYKAEWFAPNAKIIYIDNDAFELTKMNLKYAEKYCMDLRVFFKHFCQSTKYINENEYPNKRTRLCEDVCDALCADVTSNINLHSNLSRTPHEIKEKWLSKCQHWKQKWKNEMPPDYLDDCCGINPYYTLRAFFEMAQNNKNIVVSSGTIITIAWHLANMKEGDNFIISSQGDMGFELPAAIGSSISSPYKTTVAILGEGSLQFNLQELQTIVHHRLPIKILIINNGCHGSTKVTQTKFFENLYGVDKDTGMSFPDTEKLCFAYGITYLSIRRIENVEEMMRSFLYGCYDTPVVCEVFSKLQTRYPRLNAKKNADGSFSNRPYHDMEPFMTEEELAEEMCVV